jgi:hypothetical protein
MSDKAWRDQYKHPMWQKKRLEALQAAGFECQCCQDGESQLHVHHRAYIKGRNVWEYEVGELEVLCESCHSTAHASKDVLNLLIARVPVDALEEIIGLIGGYCSTASGPVSACSVDESSVACFSGARRVAVGRIAGLAQSLPIQTLIALESQINEIHDQQKAKT